MDCCVSVCVCVCVCVYVRFIGQVSVECVYFIASGPVADDSHLGLGSSGICICVCMYEDVIPVFTLVPYSCECLTVKHLGLDVCLF